MKVKILDWDSHFFKKKIGVIELNTEIGVFSDIENFDLVYVKQNEDKFIRIDNFNLTYIETKVIFSKSISKKNNPLMRFVFSALETNISKEHIYKLAYESGKYSRFKLDENFDQLEFEALYQAWVDNSFRKEFSDDILIYKENNIILGFITYEIIVDYAIIGLLGVCDKYRGKGIGRALLDTVENQLTIKHIKKLRIPTQLQNVQACGFYSKLGYNIIEKKIIKHFWKL